MSLPCFLSQTDVLSIPGQWNKIDCVTIRGWLSSSLSITAPSKILTEP